MSNSTENHTQALVTDQPHKPQYIREQHNSQCQQFFGPVTGCIFAMPGANVTQTPSPPQPSPKARERTKTCNAVAKTDDNGFEPLTATFTRRKGLTDQHFALLLSIISKEQWIMPQSEPDSFIDLFSGKESDSLIVWNPETGKGILRDLIKMMLDGGFISCPEGYGYIQVIESHFIYPSGQHVRGLKSGYASKKANAVINKCRKTLLINPKVSNYSDREEIAQMFSDIR